MLVYRCKTGLLVYGFPPAETKGLTSPKSIRSPGAPVGMKEMPSFDWGQWMLMNGILNATQQKQTPQFFLEGWILPFSGHDFIFLEGNNKNEWLFFHSLPSGRRLYLQDFIFQTGCEFFFHSHFSGYIHNSHIYIPLNSCNLRINLHSSIWTICLTQFC